MRHAATAAFLLVLAVASSASEPSRFKVTRRSLTRIEVNGGRVEGLAVGDRLLVVDGAATVAELEVVRVAQRSADCRVVSLKRPVSVGDVAIRPKAAEKPSGAARPDGTRPPATAAVMSSPAEVARTSGVDDPPDGPRASVPPVPDGNGRAGAPAPVAATTPAPPVSKAPPVAAPAPAPLPAVPAESAPTRASSAPFTVDYRSADSVYVDGGRAAGLDVGRRLEVLDGQAVVAELEVLYAAERSASCRVLSESRPVRAGDRAFLVGAPAAPAREEPGSVAAAAEPARTTALSSPAAAGGEARAARPPTRVYGAASLGFYQSWDGSETNLDYQERTARLDLVVADIAGQPLSFAVRGRLREDIRDRELSRRTPASLRTDRVYELALRYDPPDGRVGFELGRIGVSRFVGVGYLDGALVRFEAHPGIQVGAFGGRQADINALDGVGSKYGGFVRFAPGGRYARGGYDVLLAFAREDAEGDVSREYLSLEGRFAGGGRWSLFQRAELDFNRGWRQEVTGESVQLSNLGLAGNLRVSPSSWLFVSYDGLRNYRYYRNRWVPEDVFDSLLHQGLRAGVNVSKPGGLGATAGFGMSLKEDDPLNPDLNIANAYSFNGGVRHANLLGGLSVGVDGSGFTNGYTKGGLLSARAGWRAAGGHTLDVLYGYSRYRVEQTEETRDQQWLRLIGRGQLGRRFYVLGDLELDAGDDLKGPRVFVELGVVF